MLKYIIKRLLWIIPVLFGVAIVVFTILYFSPGDPAYLALGDNATPEAVEAYRVEMGIDGTYWERLGRLLTGMLHGDLGLSFRSKTPVMDELLVRFKVTFNISAWSSGKGIPDFLQAEAELLKILYPADVANLIIAVIAVASLGVCAVRHYNTVFVIKTQRLGRDIQQCRHLADGIPVFQSPHLPIASQRKIMEIL